MILVTWAENHEEPSEVTGSIETRDLHESKELTLKSAPVFISDLGFFLFFFKNPILLI